jgi:hypothetical protein
VSSGRLGPARIDGSFSAALTCALILAACGRIGFERVGGLADADADASDTADASDQDGSSDGGVVACGTDPSDPVDNDACQGLLLWLDADAAGSLSGADCASAPVATSTTVECWRDRSGYAHHLGRSTTDAPTVELSPGGLQTVRFTGVEALSGVVDEFPPGDPPMTSFVVLFPATIQSGYQVAFHLGESDCTKSIGLTFRDDSIRYYSWCHRIDFSGISITNAPLLLASWHEPGVYDTSNTFATAWGPGADPDGAMLDGQAEATEAPNVDANPGLWIGQQQHGFEAYDGAIGEIMIFARVLSDTEREAVVGHLRAKWGL